MNRIFRNAIFLYVRMLVVMVISIYTTRLVLEVLGLEDFGLFGTVAGVVSLLSFVTASMSSATSRFIAYELGKGDSARLQEVFTSAWSIHLLIAVIFLLLAETVGVWFLNHHLVIQPERLYAANVLFQLTILISILAILQVPFTASVMAYEKMNVFATVEIVAVMLKFVILFLLKVVLFDKLIFYGFLLLLISLLVFMAYVFYCRIRLGHCRMKISLRGEYVRKMLTFSGWDLYGNASVVARTQGVLVILEIFFGVVMVSAASIAASVQNAVMSFASNVLSAFRPQIVKSYASSDYATVEHLVGKAAVYTTMLLLLVTIPVYSEMEFLLSKWLVKVPPHAVEFCRLTLLFNLFANLSGVVVSAIHANGNIWRPSIINGTLYLSVIPVSLFLFRQGFPPEVAYLYNVAAVSVGMISNIWTLRLLMPSFHVKAFLYQVLFKSVIVGVGTYLGVRFLQDSLEPSWSRLLLVGVLSVSLVCGATLFYLFDQQERRALLSKIKKYVS